MEEAEKEKNQVPGEQARETQSGSCLNVEDYLKNIVKQPGILATIQLSAQKAGLDKMTGDEIESRDQSSLPGGPRLRNDPRYAQTRR